MIQKLVNYINNLEQAGISLEYADVEALYLSVDKEIRENAAVLLLPLAAANGVVYGMDSRGGIVPFAFSRITEATSFDKDNKLVIVPSGMPRIDHGNYSNDAKLLIEKSSTNLLADSNLESNFNESGTTTSSKIDIDWFNFLTKAANLYKPSEVQNYSYLYKNLTYNQDGQYIMSFYMRTASGETPKITNAYATSDVKVSVRNGSSVNPTLYDSVDGSTFRVSGTQNIVGTPNTGGAGAAKRYDNLDGNVYVSGYQLEPGLEMTSYIPTYDSAATRSADILTFDLQQACSVYLKTTKQETIFARQKGLWSVHEELNNEGILVMALFPENSLNAVLIEKGNVSRSVGKALSSITIDRELYRQTNIERKLSALNIDKEDTGQNLVMFL